MEKFLVKKDSWHFGLFALYRALTRPNSYFWGSKDYKTRIYEEQVHDSRNYVSSKGVFRDFCTYWRNVLLWPGLNLAANIVLAIAIFLVISNIPMLGAITLGLLVAIVSAVLFFGAIFGTAGLIIWFIERQVKNRDLQPKKIIDPDAPKTFFEKVYDDYKNKYCTMIEFEDK